MVDILSSLNPSQQQAVTHQGSPLLLLAGAGSGKTRVLTHRAAYFIDQKLAKTSEVLLLTFTNKAAGEMKLRMSKLIPNIQDLGTGNLFAGTFHSFCCRVLHRDGMNIGISSNFVIYDENDQADLLKAILIDMDLTPKEFSPTSLSYFIENAKNNYQSPDDISSQSTGFWATTAAKIYHRYQKKLIASQAVDFADLLFATVKLFSEFPKVLEKYQDQFRFVLVDEYQDTNQIQYLLTKLLAKKYQQITAVGDASQAIYGWRGADYHNLTSFTTDFKNTKIINLEQNYRSTQIILDAANAVISRNDSHPILKLFTKRESQDKIKVFIADSELNEADFVAAKIQFIYDNIKIPYKQIAVLYRMNAQSRVLEEAFLRASIPYVLVGGIRFYERAEVKDVLVMLRLLHNPKDQLSADRLLKVFGKRQINSFLEILPKLNPKKMTSLELIDSLLSQSGYLNRYDPKVEEDERRLENIKELKSVASTYPVLDDFLENITLVQKEYSLQEKNKSAEKREGVRLMTLHGSKGLEFEVVFLVGFEEGILPHSRSLIDKNDIEEERRLCYVGITRAKDYLFISYAKKRLYFGKSSLNEPSRFLLEIPPKLVDYELQNHSQNKSNDDFIYDPDIY